MSTVISVNWMGFYLTILYLLEVTAPSCSPRYWWEGEIKCKKTVFTRCRTLQGLAQARRCKKEIKSILNSGEGWTGRKHTVSFTCILKTLILPLPPFFFFLGLHCSLCIALSRSYSYWPWTFSVSLHLYRNGKKSIYKTSLPNIQPLHWD